MSKDKQDKILQEIGKINKRFDKIATKKDLKATNSDLANMQVAMNHRMDQMATKEDLFSVKDEVLTHIDGFVTLHQTLDQELIMPRNRCDRLEDRIVNLEQKIPLGK